MRICNRALGSIASKALRNIIAKSRLYVTAMTKVPVGNFSCCGNRIPAIIDKTQYNSAQSLNFEARIAVVEAQIIASQHPARDRYLVGTAAVELGNARIAGHLPPDLSVL